VTLISRLILNLALAGNRNFLKDDDQDALELEDINVVADDLPLPVTEHHPISIDAA
jgi:hypothetical protein